MNMKLMAILVACIISSCISCASVSQFEVIAILGGEVSVPKGMVFVEGKGVDSSVGRLVHPALGIEIGVMLSDHAVQQVDPAKRDTYPYYREYVSGTERTRIAGDGGNLFLADYSGAFHLSFYCSSKGMTADLFESVVASFEDVPYSSRRNRARPLSKEATETYLALVKNGVLSIAALYHYWIETGHGEESPPLHLSDVVHQMCQRFHEIVYCLRILHAHDAIGQTDADIVLNAILGNMMEMPDTFRNEALDSMRRMLFDGPGRGFLRFQPEQLELTNENFPQELLKYKLGK